MDLVDRIIFVRNSFVKTLEKIGQLKLNFYYMKKKKKKKKGKKNFQPWPGATEIIFSEYNISENFRRIFPIVIANALL